MTASKNTRLAHIVNLLCVAGIDGKITDEERNVIINIAENIGLTSGKIMIQLHEKYERYDSRAEESSCRIRSFRRVLLV